MVQPTDTIKATLLIALAFSLASCGKQNEQPSPTTPEAAASSPSLSMGNGTKAATLADCDKLLDPKPADTSAAGRATAVSQGAAARAACKKEMATQSDKPNADLARIREIKEKEQADLADRKISEKEWGKRINEGAGKPIKEYKY